MLLGTIRFRADMLKLLLRSSINSKSYRLKPLNNPGSLKSKKKQDDKRKKQNEY